MENKVKICREGKGLTQKQLSEMSGVPQATISEVESGGRTPGVDVALRLAQALGATVEQLFAL